MSRKHKKAIDMCADHFVLPADANQLIKIQKLGDEDGCDMYKVAMVLAPIPHYKHR
ncbi:hypothetical protein ABP1_0802 [Bacillus subtilis]|nr:hypothetical protein ABP1_0802 [Bacillus subtilis]